jgi:four helix bundle protein
MNRAVVSIASNIAEGTSRSLEKEFVRFLEISVGSGFELKTQLTITHKMGYIDSLTFDRIIESLDKVLRQLNGLRSSIIGSKTYCGL